MKTSNLITSRKVYALMRSYWHIEPVRAYKFNMRLLELRLSSVDINWMLNSIEWKYHISIVVETISPNDTVEGFVRKVLSSASAFDQTSSP